MNSKPAKIFNALGADSPQVAVSVPGSKTVLRFSINQSGLNRRLRGFTLLELLLTVAIIIVITALLLPALNRSKEKAKRAKCENQLHQFYALAFMYAEDHEGYLCSYDDMLRQTSMLCPSDDSSGNRQRHIQYAQPTSYFGSPFVFLGGTNKGARLEDWGDASHRDWWFVEENEPFHDSCKQIGFEPDKWKGRLLELRLDGSTSWPLMEQ